MLIRRSASMAILSAQLLIASAADAPAPPPGAATTPHVAVLSADQVVQILDQTVDWYRTLGPQQQAATQPSDLLILYANQQTANQVVALAFEIARANAELLSSEAKNAPAAAPAPTAGAAPAAGAAAGTPHAAGATAVSAPTLDAIQKKLQAQRQSIQAEMDADRRQIATSQGAGKADLQGKLSELQGELDMMDARSNLLDTMTQFVSASDANSASANALKAHIDAIAATVPSQGSSSVPAASAAPAGTAAPASAAAPATAAAPAAKTPAAPVLASFPSGGSTADRVGIWDLAANALRLSEKIGTINTVDRGTSALAETFAKIRSQPLEQLKHLSAQSDELASQADDAHGAALKSVREQLDTLAWLFKQTSAMLIPLSKEGVLLQQYRHNLDKWRQAVEHEYQQAIRALGVRLGILVALLAIVFAGAELWKRAVLRYTHDPRRRYQLLLLRRITLWTLVVVILGFTFVTELSSFATFAGLLTAGVAVAMQSVLVSIVGYFFLIGKYGIRVGDRVQIGNVSGEVIDLGLVRMHLMELNSQGPLGATGRVVAFANSIVFQASGGLFKQIPGVNFAWHEATLNLPADCDYAAVKEKLIAAVSDIVKDYQEEIVRQTQQIEKTTSSSSVGGAKPQVQLRFSATGVEALVRYPVQLQHVAEIDERVSKELTKVIAQSKEAHPAA
jgi:small-conductance mechanosensitive channel